MFGGENKIIKTMEIEGMSCGHCSKKVEMALKDLKEVKSVKVSLENKNAEIVLRKEIEENSLRNLIEDLGYKVINIK